MGALDTLDRIILLMNEKNYNQQILTDYLGVDKSIFSTWKNGKSKSYMKLTALTEMAIYSRKI